MTVPLVERRGEKGKGKKSVFHSQRMFEITVCASVSSEGSDATVDKILVELIKDYIQSKPGLVVKLMPKLPIIKCRENDNCLLGGCLSTFVKHHLCALERDAEPQVIPEGLCL